MGWRQLGRTLAILGEEMNTLRAAGSARIIVGVVSAARSRLALQGQA